MSSELPTIAITHDDSFDENDGTSFFDLHEALTDLEDLYEDESSLIMRVKPKLRIRLRNRDDLTDCEDLDVSDTEEGCKYNENTHYTNARKTIQSSAGNIHRHHQDGGLLCEPHSQTDVLTDVENFDTDSELSDDLTGSPPAVKITLEEYLNDDISISDFIKESSVLTKRTNQKQVFRKYKKINSRRTVGNAADGTDTEALSSGNECIRESSRRRKEHHSYKQKANDKAASLLNNIKVNGYDDSNETAEEVNSDEVEDDESVRIVENSDVNIPEISEFSIPKSSRTLVLLHEDQRMPAMEIMPMTDNNMMMKLNVDNNLTDDEGLSGCDSAALSDCDEVAEVATESLFEYFEGDKLIVDDKCRTKRPTKRAASLVNQTKQMPRASSGKRANSLLLTSQIEGRALTDVECLSSSPEDGDSNSDTAPSHATLNVDMRKRNKKYTQNVPVHLSAVSSLQVHFNDVPGDSDVSDVQSEPLQAEESDYRSRQQVCKHHIIPLDHAEPRVKQFFHTTSFQKIDSFDATDSLSYNMSKSCSNTLELLPSSDALIEIPVIKSYRTSFRITVSNDCLDDTLHPYPSALNAATDTKGTSLPNFFNSIQYSAIKEYSKALRNFKQTQCVSNPKHHPNDESTTFPVQFVSFNSSKVSKIPSAYCEWIFDDPTRGGDGDDDDTSKGRSSPDEKS